MSVGGQRPAPDTGHSVFKNVMTSAQACII